MIDSSWRSPYQRFCVNPIVARLKHLKVTPHHLTIIALLTGVATLPAIAYGQRMIALALLAFSGYCDTLDGSLARAKGQASPQGAALDIVSDRIVEFAVTLGLFFYAPQERALDSLLMLGSVLICITSFLVVGIFSENNSQKSFFYSPGVMERTEAFACFALMIAFPGLFWIVAKAFSALVLLTGLIRVYQFHAASEPS